MPAESCSEAGCRQHQVPALRPQVQETIKINAHTVLTWVFFSFFFLVDFRKMLPLLRAKLLIFFFLILITPL